MFRYVWHFELTIVRAERSLSSLRVAFDCSGHGRFGIEGRSGQVVQKPHSLSLKAWMRRHHIGFTPKYGYKITCNSISRDIVGITWVVRSRWYEGHWNI